MTSLPRGAGLEAEILCVAHGASAGGSDRLRALVDALRRRLQRPVSLAFYREEPRLGPALLEGERDVIIVPLAMADGWFVNTVIPRTLGVTRADMNDLGDGRFAWMTNPLGCHPALADAVASMTEGIDGELVIVGHGTPRHRASRDSVLAIVARLRPTRAQSVQAAFIDDQPGLAELGSLWPNPASVVVVPAFIGDGPHIAELETLAEQLARDRDWRLHVTPPLGSSTVIEALIEDLVADADQVLSTHRVADP